MSLACPRRNLVGWDRKDGFVFTASRRDRSQRAESEESDGLILIIITYRRQRPAMSVMRMDTGCSVRLWREEEALPKRDPNKLFLFELIVKKSCSSSNGGEYSITEPSQDYSEENSKVTTIQS